MKPLAIAATALACITAHAEPGTLDKVKASGTLTLAYRESSIPFSYLGACLLYTSPSPRDS